MFYIVSNSLQLSTDAVLKGIYVATFPFACCPCSQLSTRKPRPIRVLLAETSHTIFIFRFACTLFPPPIFSHFIPSQLISWKQTTEYSGSYGLANWKAGIFFQAKESRAVCRPRAPSCSLHFTQKKAHGSANKHTANGR